MILNFLNAWTNCQLHVLGCFETLRRKNRRFASSAKFSRMSPIRTSFQVAWCEQDGFEQANLTSTKEAGKQGPVIKHNPRMIRMIRIRASVNFLLFVSYRKHLETNGCCKSRLNFLCYALVRYQQQELTSKLLTSSDSLHHHLSYVSYPHRGPGFV